MGFVALKNGGEVRFDEVVLVVPNRDGYFIETKSHGRLETTSQYWEAALEREFTSVIPAQPGTFFLTRTTLEDDSVV